MPNKSPTDLAREMLLIINPNSTEFISKAQAIAALQSVRTGKTLMHAVLEIDKAPIAFDAYALASAVLEMAAEIERLRDAERIAWLLKRMSDCEDGLCIYEMSDGWEFGNREWLEEDGWKYSGMKYIAGKKLVFDTADRERIDGAIAAEGTRADG